MAHFAEIDGNNIVLRVLVVDDSQESNGQNFQRTHQVLVALGLRLHTTQTQEFIAMVEHL